MMQLCQDVNVRVVDMPIRVQQAIARDRKLSDRYGEEETRRINNWATVTRLRSWFSGRGISSKNEQ